MFDVVRNNPKIAQVCLVLITVPFALFGVDSYFRNASVGSDSIAKVGKGDITVQAFDNAIRQQSGQVPAAQLESPVFRKMLLDKLIEDQVIESVIAENRFSVPDAMVQEAIRAMPQFQENGQFSMRLYQSFVQNPQYFEYQQRRILARQAFLQPIEASVRTPAGFAAKWLALEGEERTVAAWIIDAKAKADSLKLPADAAKKFFDENPKKFQQPEQVKVEYIVLSLDELSAKEKISDEAARKWYDEHKNDAKFYTEEQRTANHILIDVAPDAKPEDKAAARKKAEEVLAKAKADPTSFGKLAKAYSTDKLSAENGGALSAFTKKDMEATFSDAAFKLKPKEISDIVETKYGFHIIQLTGIPRAGGSKPFDAVRADVIAELAREGASKRFSEIGEQFGNMVYEQPDALKPIADKLSLSLQSSDWLSADTLPKGVLSAPKMRTALFSQDAIKNKRNSEAIDLGNGTSISFRVVDYRAARTKAFDEVKTEAESLARLAEGKKQAAVDGEAALAKLRSGGAIDAKWAAARAVKRADPLPEPVRKAIFAAPATKLPAYTGVASEAGYVLFRIEKVNSPVVGDKDPRLAQVSDAYAAVLGQEDMKAYLAALKNRVGVKIDDAKLVPKNAQ